MGGIILATRRKTLYWFRLDTETGNISVIPIKEYSDIVDGRNTRYRIKVNNLVYYAYKNKLDIVRNWSMFSFNSSEEEAKEKFRNFLVDKFDKADKDAKRYSRLLKEVLGN